jgi:predicted Zn-dependent peptidase
VNVMVVPRVTSSEIVVETAVERDAAVDALLEIVTAIDRVRTEPVTEVDLLGGQADGRIRFWKDIETSSDAVDALTPIAAAGEPLDRFYERVRGSVVTREDLQFVARRYLSDASRGIVVAGDAERLLPRLTSLGLGTIAVRRLAPARAP